jgi:hypothetical protein
MKRSTLNLFVTFVVVCVVCGAFRLAGFATVYAAQHRAQHAPVAVDAPKAAPLASVAPSSEPDIIQLAPVTIKGEAPAKHAAVKRAPRVYRCETRALQMGTIGDTVQDCYWHDR